MAVVNLHDVTDTLCRLVRFNVFRLGGLAANVTNLPPEKADDASNSHLNLHLFHATEDASKRNEFARDSASEFPIKEIPYPLVLYYVLTANFGGNDMPNVPLQQEVMGLAMKTMRDFPSFDERLELPNPTSNALEPVFPSTMRGKQNRVEIIPRQLSPEEAVNFWSAAPNRTARLTAYYEVRSTLMFADEVERRTGLVTRYGLGVTPGGRPRLTASSSSQTAVLPTGLGGGTLVTTLSPAEVAMGSTVTPSAARVTVTGMDMGDGSTETLLLSGPEGEIDVDPTANPAWAFRFSAGSFGFTVQPTALTTVAGSIVSKTIVPGIYAMALRRNLTLATSAGRPRAATSQSNRLPFAVGAAVRTVTVLAGPPRLRIDLEPGVDAVAALASTEISIAGEVYASLATGAPQPGEFRATGASRFEVWLTFDPTDGATRLVRLGIAGVDCAPFWITP